MADRDPKDETRGWSVVLKMIEQPDEKKSAQQRKQSKSKKDEPAPPKVLRDAERTVIDGRLADVLAKELDKEDAKALLRQVALRDEDTEGSEPARSARDTDPGESPAPIEFNESTSPHGVVINEPTSVDRRILIPDEHTSIDPEETFDDAATLAPDRHMMRSGSHAKPTVHEVKGVSADAKTSPDRPPRVDPKPAKITVSDPKRPGGEVRVTGASPSVIAREKAKQPAPHPDPADDDLLDSPPIPVHLLKELGPVENMRDVEMTVLDLAAQLGLAPEPTVPKTEEPTEDAPRAQILEGDSAPPAPAPVGQEGAKVVEILEEEAAKPQVRYVPGAGPRDVNHDHLPGIVAATEGAAKIIPVLIATFVVFATIAAVIMLFSGSGASNTEHVQLRFLPVEAKPTVGSEFLPAPMFTIETEPEGLLIVLDRKILGQTPLTFELPMRAEKVGVELAGPYFETWIGEAVREPTGEMRLLAKLKRKR